MVPCVTCKETLPLGLSRLPVNCAAKSICPPSSTGFVMKAVKIAAFTLLQPISRSILRPLKSTLPWATINPPVSSSAFIFIICKSPLL